MTHEGTDAVRAGDVSGQDVERARLAADHEHVPPRGEATLALPAAHPSERPGPTGRRGEPRAPVLASTKRCSTCHGRFPLAKFPRDPQRRDGRRNECRMCRCDRRRRAARSSLGAASHRGGTVTAPSCGSIASASVQAAPLRDYQARAIEACRDAYRRGRRSILVVSPTGSGKTRIGVEIARSALDRGGRVLWIAHRSELLEQAAARLAAEGVLVGALGGILVESVQTLITRPTLPDASVVIFDEAHHYVAAEWGRIGAHYASALRVGLTATPERGDRSPLGDMFEELVSVATVRELTAKGYLVPCRVVAPARLERGLAEDPVVVYRDRAAGRRCVVFGQDIAHARELAERFTVAGFPAACVDGRLASGERAARLADFRAGRLVVLTNVFVLTEGWDAPETEVCIVARGCSAAATWLQMIGRALRPAPGKTDALIVDLRGAVHEHGLPDADRKYSLEGKAIRTAERLRALAQCRACGAVYLWRETCPECGAKAPSQPKPRLTRAQLDEVRAVSTVDMKRTHYARLLAEARARGYSPRWAGMKFKARYGHWPTWAMMSESPVASPKEAQAG